MKLPRDETIGLALLGAGLVALALLLPGEPGAGGPAPLRVAFGGAATMVVLALVAGGVALLFAGRLGWQVRWPAIAAAEAGLLVLLAVAHLNEREPWLAARVGRGGGLIGWALSQLLLAVFPAELAYALLILAGAAALVAFWHNLPPTWTARPAAWIGRTLALLEPRRAERSAARPAGRAVRPPTLGHLAKLTMPLIGAGRRLAAGWGVLRGQIGRALAALLPSPTARPPASAGRSPAASTA
ncbi:MAG: hypothetical protein ACP5UQ_07830, partial [Anaerolineae bacterium]